MAELGSARRICSRAVCQTVLERKRRRHAILYLSCEQAFINQFVNAIQNNRHESVPGIASATSMWLVIDDIHFLGRRSRTIAGRIFPHIQYAVSESQADHPVSRLVRRVRFRNWKERLVSRFKLGSGRADRKKPCYETRHRHPSEKRASLTWIGTCRKIGRRFTSRAKLKNNTARTRRRDHEASGNGNAPARA